MSTKRRRLVARRWGAASLVAIGLTALAAAPAAADHAVTDAARGVDHSGTLTPPSPSTVCLLLTVTAPEGTVVRIQSTGPGGPPQVTEGTVDETGRVALLRPIESYGTFRVIGLQFIGPDGVEIPLDDAAWTEIWSFLPDEAPNELTVTDAESSCDPATLAPRPAPTTEPPSTSTTAATPTTKPTETTPTAAPTGNTVGPTRTRDDDSGDPRDEPVWPWILIAVGVGIAGGGIYLVTRPRPRVCDWAAYWQLPGGALVPLRITPHHECCVYVFSVDPVSWDINSAERVGQGDDAERPLELRRHAAMDQSPQLQGIGTAVSAEVRSAPESDLAWVQGLGHRGGTPTTSDEVTAYLAEHAGQPDREPPDALASADLSASYWFRVEFSQGCQGVHGFDNVASVLSEHVAEIECTNTNGQPDCAVELTAATHLRATGKGQLTWTHDHRAATRPDDLEAMAERLSGGDDAEPVADAPHTLEDLHDHRERDRMRSTGDGATTASSKNFGDFNNIVVTVHGESHAGATVPLVARPTTGRVTALVSGALSQLVDIVGMAISACQPSPPLPGGPPGGNGGVMIPGGGRVHKHANPAELAAELVGKGVPANIDPCCGMDGCLCAPSFRWTINNDTMTLVVGGSVFVGPTGSGAPAGAPGGPGGPGGNGPGAGGGGAGAPSGPGGPVIAG